MMPRLAPQAVLKTVDSASLMRVRVSHPPPVVEPGPSVARTQVTGATFGEGRVPVHSRDLQSRERVRLPPAPPLSQFFDNRILSFAETESVSPFSEKVDESAGEVAQH